MWRWITLFLTGFCRLVRPKPLSGLLADHDLESDIGTGSVTGSVSVSSVTSPISQSSYNPLLDELVHQASDDSAYMVMSTATSSGINEMHHISF